MVTLLWDMLQTLAFPWIAMCTTHRVSAFFTYLTMEHFYKTFIMISAISAEYSMENTSISNEDYLKVCDRNSAF